MQILPNSPTDVKIISFFLELWHHNCIQLLSDDRQLYPEPYSTFKVYPPNLLWWRGELDDPEATLNPFGFYYYDKGNGKILAPIKSFHPITSLAGRDLDVFVFLIKAPENPKDYGKPYIPDIIRFDRCVQPGELDPDAFKRWRDAIAAQHPEPVWQTEQNPFLEPTFRQAIGLPDIVPGLPPEISPQLEGPKPTAERVSVGRTRKFAWIRPHIMELMEADRLPMNRIEVYRIIYTFRKYPERTRERPAGYGPRYRFAYTTIYQSQISHYLEVRRKDIMATARGDRRKQAKRMGTCPRTVQYAVHDLCRLGYIARVYPGRPKDYPWLSEEQQAHRLRRHERHPQYGPQKYTVATDRRQRDYIKTLYRKLKEAGLPPYNIYLKDLKA